MMRFGIVTLAIFGFLFTADSLNAQDNPLNLEEIAKMLSQPVKTQALQKKMPLKDALEYFLDKTRGKLQIIVNESAFVPTKNGDIYDTEVLLPPFPPEMSVALALELIVSQIEDGKATFVIRRGVLEILPESHATAKHLLSRRVMVFDIRSLTALLAEVSEQTGLTINIDAAAADKVAGAKPIPAKLRNVSAEDALVAVTEMAELKFVVLNQSVLITTPQKAKLLLKEANLRKKK